jgi:hypothetical protein
VHLFCVCSCVCLCSAEPPAALVSFVLPQYKLCRSCCLNICVQFIYRVCPDHTHAQHCSVRGAAAPQASRTRPRGSLSDAQLLVVHTRMVRSLEAEKIAPSLKTSRLIELEWPSSTPAYSRLPRPHSLIRPVLPPPLTSSRAVSDAASEQTW